MTQNVIKSLRFLLHTSKYFHVCSSCLSYLWCARSVLPRSKFVSRFRSLFTLVREFTNTRYPSSGRYYACSYFKISVFRDLFTRSFALRAVSRVLGSLPRLALTKGNKKEIAVERLVFTGMGKMFEISEQLYLPSKHTNNFTYAVSYVCNLS